MKTEHKIMKLVQKRVHFHENRAQNNEMNAQIK